MTDLQTAISKIRAECKRVFKQNERMYAKDRPSNFELASAKGWLEVCRAAEGCICAGKPPAICIMCAALIEMADSLEER